MWEVEEAMQRCKGLCHKKSAYIDMSATQGYRHEPTRLIVKVARQTCIAASSDSMGIFIVMAFDQRVNTVLAAPVAGCKMTSLTVHWAASATASELTSGYPWGNVGCETHQAYADQTSLCSISAGCVGPGLAKPSPFIALTAKLDRFTLQPKDWLRLCQLEFSAPQGCWRGMMKATRACKNVHIQSRASMLSSDQKGTC